MGNCCVQPPLSRPGSFTPLQKNRQRESTTTVGSKPGKECRRGDGTKVSSPRGKGPDAGRRFERVESDVAPRRGACASSLAEKLGESTADVTCELITLQATPLTNNLRTPHDAMLRSTLRTPQDALDNSDLFSDDAARQRPRHPLSSTAARPFSDSGIHPFFDAGARSFSDSGVRPFPEGAARPRPQLLDPSRTTLTVPYFASTNPFSSTLSCTPIQVDDTYYTDGEESESFMTFESQVTTNRSYQTTSVYSLGKSRLLTLSERNLAALQQMIHSQARSKVSHVSASSELDSRTDITPGDMMAGA